jgi:phage-related baseplate assembly protein
MYASNPAIYQFTDSQLNIGWRIASTIQAQVAGAAGNTASNTITSLNQSVSGITSVYNDLPTLGGTDIETNQSLGERIQAKLTGNNVGTSTGVKSLVLTNPLVEDVSVVGPNDPEMQRNQYGGSVDVYILGNNNIGIVEQQIYSSLVGYLEIAHTPAHSVSIVSGIVSGLPHTFTLGVEAVFVKDVGLFAGSISEDSRITFPTLVKPDDGTQVSITLTYDSLIPTLQNLINLPENNILASDILLRECIDVVVDVYAELVLFSGYTPSVVAAAVKTAVTTYLDSTKLGISVISSELVSIITGIDGVDSVKLSTFIPENDIAIGKNQVSVAGTIALKIGNTIY